MYYIVVDIIYNDVIWIKKVSYVDCLISLIDQDIDQ